MTTINYSPIRIRTLRPQVEIPFPLFIHFKEQYIPYLQSGQSIDKDKFKKLKKQKIAKFFIDDNDESNYQNFVDTLLESTLASTETAVEEKIDLIEGQTANAIDGLSKDPGSEDSFNQTRKAAKNIQKLLDENPEALKSMYGEERQDNEAIVKHSLNVAALSIKLAKSLKVKEEEIDYLTTAALMHDIGLLQMPEEDQAMFEKDPATMAAKERTQYNQHCNNIVEVLQDKPYINAEILELILNHEENLAGEGPHKKSKLTLPQEILSLVNTYDKKILHSQKTPQEVLKMMMIEEMGKYDLKNLQALQKIL